MSCECKNLELIAETIRYKDEMLEQDIRTTFHKCPDCKTIYKSRMMTLLVDKNLKDITVHSTVYSGLLTEEDIRKYIPGIKGTLNNCDECKEKLKQ